MSRLFLGSIVDATGKKGHKPEKKGQLTGKKGQFAGCQKRRKPLLHKALRAVLARARKKTKNKEKNQQKTPLPKPGLWATSGAAGVPRHGAPLRGSPPLRGGSPSPIEPPGRDPAPGWGRCPWRGFALPPRPRRREPREQGGAALRLLRPAPRQRVGRSRSVKGRCAFRGGPCPRFAAGRASHPLHP